MCMGKSDAETKTISVNLNQKPTYEILDTVVHESTHADQNDLVDKKNKAKDDENAVSDYKHQLERSGLSSQDVVLMDWEQCHYLSTTDSINQIGNLKLYFMQLIETEAYFESVKFLRKHSESFKQEDSSFAAIIEEKENEFKTFKTCYEEEETVKTWFEDRRKRFEENEKGWLSDTEQGQLNTIFSLNDFKKCGFKLFESLEKWDKSLEERVKAVSLDELSEKNAEAGEHKPIHSAEMKPTLAKKPGLGMGL